MMKLRKSLLMAPALLASSLGMMAGDGVTVEHLGVNNTFVRINGDGRYLLLPVQESVADAKVNVLIDGKLERTFYVRLAKSKVDYTVPLDLEPYKGHNVVLDINANHDRSSVREAKEGACWDAITLSNTFDTTNREKFRPVYHHTPEWGWMNDPNGMFYKDGEWHLYYQWNPFGSKWQNMTWGHSSSSDLINWKHHAVAIEPDGLGTIFSGSCALDPDNSTGFGKDAIVALYTAANTSQMQSLAHSDNNGESFIKYPGNPVFTLETEARDPNMFWNQESKQWNIMLAHALEHEILFLTSPDLKTWTLQSAFGKGFGAQDGVWECPDLFPLTVNGKKKWVLLVNINPGGPFGGSATQYFVGDFDGKTFTADTDKSGKIPTKWMDYGKDHYATVTWSDAPDGRRTAIGWMSNWQYAADVPTTQFRSANTLPRDLSLFKGNDGQLYLASNPSPETLKLRDESVVKEQAVNTSATATSFSLPAANNGICEVVFDIEAKKNSKVFVTLSNSKNEEVVITYNPADNTIAFDRTKAGISDFSRDFPAVTVSPTFTKNGKTSVRMFIDRSSIEMFAKDGKYVMTNLVFPNEPYSNISFTSDGSAKISNLEIYSLKPSSSL
ncbi:MAG: DUF4980 domain-containing protein [Muribaculaceae bacterium]|nr:DUF4980 domain-containing protein [Muribaculaceae bacterium]